MNPRRSAATDIGWLLLGVNFGLLLYEPAAPWRGLAQLALPAVALLLFVVNAVRTARAEPDRAPR